MIPACEPPGLTPCAPLDGSALARERLAVEYTRSRPATVLRIFMVDAAVWESRQCKNCGGAFDCRTESRAKFGSEDCKRQNDRRRQARGLYIIDDLLRWRGDRSDATALADVCAKLSAMLDQDRAAGRPSW